MAGFAPPPKTEDKYPEHTKLMNRKDRTEIVNEFFEWLDEKHPHTYLATEMEGQGDFGMRSISKSEYDRYLADWIGIDLEVIEREKRSMLNALRGSSG